MKGFQWQGVLEAILWSRPLVLGQIRNSFGDLPLPCLCCLKYIRQKLHSENTITYVSQEVNYTQRTLKFLFVISNNAIEQECLCRTSYFPLFRCCCDFIIQKNQISCVRGRSPFPGKPWDPSLPMDYLTTRPCLSHLTISFDLFLTLLVNFNKDVFKHLDAETGPHFFCRWLCVKK